MADATYVAEITVWDPAAGGGSGAAVTKYYATDGFATIGTDTPADTHVDERLKQPLQINRTMFAPNATRGRSSVGYGDIILVNGDGELDAFTTYGVDGRTVKVYRGTIGDAYPGSWTKIFEGTMQGVEVTQEYVSLKIRDELARLNVPLQTTKYAGSGLGTLEGTEDTLKGKPKPICYGVVKNIAPPCVETAKLIYQVADGTVNSIAAVYDRGVELLAAQSPMLITSGATDVGIYYSTDGGDTWTNQATSISDAGIGTYHVRYGNGIWMLVHIDSTAAQIQTSSDGLTWTARNARELSSDTDSGRDAVFVFDKWILVGESGKVVISTDNGATWERIPGLPSASGDLGTIKFLKDVVVVMRQPGAASTQFWYSHDGVNYTLGTLPSNIYYDMEYADTLGLFLTVGETSGGVPVVYTSPDLATWTSRTVPASHTGGPYRGIVWAESTLVVVGHNSAATAPLIATSTNGTAWTARTASEASARFRAVAHDGSNFIVVGRDGGGDHIETSPDGTTWTEQLSTASGGFFFGVGFGEGDAGDEYTSDTDLLDNSLAPRAGHFKVYRDATDGSFFRLGAAPDGLVTADVTQGAAASNRTTAQIWATILDTRAGMASGDWNATDVTDLDSANNDVIGFWTDQEGRVADVIDAVKDSAGAASYPDATGVFRIRQFTAPSGAAVLSITANDLIRPLQRRLPAEQGQGIPQYRTILRYQKNYTPQITDVAASVTDSRRAFLANEWREIADTDTAVQAKHLLAIESVEETLLDVAADATTEADRRQTLRGTDRQMFEMWLQLNDDTADLDLNDVIDLTHDRYGLSGTESFRIIGINLNVEKREVALTVWG